MDVKLITKKTLRDEYDERVRSGRGPTIEPVGMTPTIIGDKLDRANEPAMYESLMQTPQVGYQPRFRDVGKYGSPYDIPRVWSDGITMSVREAIRTRKLVLPATPQGSSNTLLPDWQNLWDAVRIDLSIRKVAQPTIREYFYREISMPNATRTITPTELFPYGVVFERNNGEGQAVPQGELIGGQFDSITIEIYAAGFTWSLINELFNEAMDDGRLGDAVALGYSALRDDLGLRPIISYGFGAEGSPEHTAPAGDINTGRQESLYLTLENAIDDLSNREDPITGRKIDVSGAMVLTSEWDARHIVRVAQGLPSTNERYYPAIAEISRVFGYDGETIQLRDRNVTYPGVPRGTAFIAIPNRYMVIPVKRSLQIEIDMQPSVATLTRQQRAYWFAEGIYWEGVRYFVQEVTLPPWGQSGGGVG